MLLTLSSVLIKLIFLEISNTTPCYKKLTIFIKLTNNQAYASGSTSGVSAGTKVVPL